MQQGLKINNQVEKFLLKIGYKLNDFDENIYVVVRWYLFNFQKNS